MLLHAALYVPIRACAVVPGDAQGQVTAYCVWLLQGILNTLDSYVAAIILALRCFTWTTGTGRLCKNGGGVATRRGQLQEALHRNPQALKVVCHHTKAQSTRLHCVRSLQDSGIVQPSVPSASAMQLHRRLSLVTVTASQSRTVHCSMTAVRWVMAATWHLG